MKHSVLLTLFIIGSVINLYGQDFEGIITYEVSYSNLTDEMKAMLPKEAPKPIFSIKGSQTKMEMNMMGTKMIVLSDAESNTSTSYMDVMGQKIKSISQMEDLDGLEVTLIDGETKKIAGYLCKKAIMKQPDLTEVEVYYAEDLKSNAFLSMQSQFKKLKGIPLEYQVSQQGMTMIYSAKEVIKKSLSDSVFDPPSGEYQEAPAMPKY